MKKILSMMAVFGLGSNAVAGVTATGKVSMQTAANQQTETINPFSIDGEPKLNWDEIETNLNSDIEALSNREGNFSGLEEGGEPLPEEALAKIKEDSVTFLGEVKNFDTSEAVFERLFELSPEFKKSYEEELAKALEEELANSQSLFSGPSLAPFAGMSEEEARLRRENYQYARAIVKGSVVAASMGSVAAGIAAAIYWANAWWFGITIPAAVSATALSIGLTAYAMFAEHIFLKTDQPFKFFSKLVDEWTITDLSNLIGAWDILVRLGTILLGYTIGASASLSLVAWSSPTAWGVIGTMLTIVSLFQYALRA